MRVSVFGLGYVGCVSAACLARHEHHVVGVDISREKVDAINAGRAPIVEPGLEALVASGVGSGHLRATDSAAEAIAASDVALITVGTPDLGHGHQDLGALARVASDIGLACHSRSRPLILVLRSTVLPGTTSRLLERVVAQQAGCTARVAIAVNPEFMREGSSIEDFEHPPFVLAGTDDETAADALQALYADIDAPFIRTSVATAEMVKYVCNAFHALKICFTNEVADLCESLGANAQEVMGIVQRDRKLNISTAYLTPGFAFGGSCLPKDVRALVAVSRVRDLPAPVLGAILPSNDAQVRRGVDAVLRTRRRRIGIVGLAFKSDTDDLRDSPMVSVAEALIGKGCDLRIYDPNVVMARLHGANRRHIEAEIPHIAALLCSLEDLVAHAEVLVFGAPGREADRVAAAASPDQVIVDLTRGRVCAPDAQAPSEPRRAVRSSLDANGDVALAFEP
jgi:GDP-mannose 6-dehydrogenase